VLLFLHCSIEWWWWVHVWRLASTSLPFNPCHLLLNFSKIILAFPCNFWISYLMRLSAPLNSTTFICSWDCLYTFEFNHIHSYAIIIHSDVQQILAQQTPSLWKGFAMDFLHHRIAWLPCALSPFVSNLLMNPFFLLRRRQLGFPKTEITTILFGQFLLPQGTFSSVYRCDIWPAWLVTQPLPNVCNGELSNWTCEIHFIMILYNYITMHAIISTLFVTSWNDGWMFRELVCG
jgi:hypothetical protein